MVFDSDYVFYFGEDTALKEYGIFPTITLWESFIMIRRSYFLHCSFNQYGIVNMKNKTFSWLTNGFRERTK